MPVAGGATTAIANGAWGADWVSDETIVFGSNQGLRLVSELGAEPAPLTTVTDGELFHGNPVSLPDGRRGVVLRVDRDRATAQVAVYDFASGERKGASHRHLADFRGDRPSALLARRLIVGGGV